jgi:hypothetical protein
MARNGSGTYNRAVAPYVAGTTITAATVNSEMDDIATALTQSISRDGQSPPTANRPMGNFRITGLANAVSSMDAAPLGQVVAKAGDTMTGALGFAVGTAAAPGVFVAGDANTGLFQAAAAPDTLSVSVGGTEVARFGAGGFMRLENGTAAAPAFSFSGDTDTGIYNPSANRVAVSLGGVLTLDVRQADAILYGDAAQVFSGFYMQNLGASASNQRVMDFSALNEIGIPGTSIFQRLAADGSAHLELYATPSGARNTDRRVNRMTIPGSGAISLTGDADVAGNLRFNSGYGSTAIAFGVRAWVNFNGTGTVAIRGSGGLTSITDNGTGDYTANYNFTMPDTNYAVVGNASGNSIAAVSNVLFSPTRTTSSCRILTSDNNSDALQDNPNVDVIIVR